MKRVQRDCVLLIAAMALLACGGAQLHRASKAPIASATLSRRGVFGGARTTLAAGRPARTLHTHPRSSRIDGILARAKETYISETEGRVVHEQLDRIARDSVLLNDLRGNDMAGAQAEANVQLRIPLNHFVHVTRIGVVRGSRLLVNATVNADGVFVIPPARRTLSSHGRSLGTLLVSIQDVTGYVKIVHDLTGATVVARGSSGRVRASLGAGAAANAHLPNSGHVTIAGRRYTVSSLHVTAWSNEAQAKEPLTVWILD